MLFTVEFVARLMAYGLPLFLGEDSLWSILDAIIVGSSLWDLCVDIVEAVQAQSTETAGFSGVSSLKAFRVVRITRIVKARLMTALKSLKICG